MMYGVLLAVLAVVSVSTATEDSSHLIPVPEVTCTKNSDSVNYDVVKCNKTNKLIIKLNISDVVHLTPPPLPEIVKESTTVKQYDEYVYEYEYVDEDHDVLEDAVTHSTVPAQLESDPDIFHFKFPFEIVQPDTTEFCKQEDPRDQQPYMDQDPEEREGYELVPGVGMYRFHTWPLTWEEARQVCENEGAHLAVLNSRKEADTLVRMMQRCRSILSTHFNSYAYLGVHDNLNEGQFLTVLGEPLEETGFVEWAWNQPDNAHHMGENCVTMNRQGFYNDVPCHVKLAFFCEVN